jgi:hypothetical protein
MLLLLNRSFNKDYKQEKRIAKINMDVHSNQQLKPCSRQVYSTDGMSACQQVCEEISNLSKRDLATIHYNACAVKEVSARQNML